MVRSRLPQEERARDSMVRPGQSPSRVARGGRRREEREQEQASARAWGLRCGEAQICGA